MQMNIDERGKFIKEICQIINENPLVKNRVVLRNIADPDHAHEFHSGLIRAGDQEVIRSILTRLSNATSKKTPFRKLKR